MAVITFLISLPAKILGRRPRKSFKRDPFSQGFAKSAEETRLFLSERGYVLIVFKSMGLKECIIAASKVDLKSEKLDKKLSTA
jgi:hypothetical protein